MPGGSNREILAMTRSLVVVLAGCTMLVTGCLRVPASEERSAGLREPGQVSASSTAEIAALEQEQAGLIEELSAAGAEREKALSDLELTRHFLENERQIVSQVESRLSELETYYQEVVRERERLQAKSEHLTQQVESAREDLTGSQHALMDAQTRIEDLEKERDDANAALAVARDQTKGLEAALAADHESWTRLRKALSQVGSLDTRPSEPAEQAR